MVTAANSMKGSLRANSSWLVILLRTVMASLGVRRDMVVTVVANHKRTLGTRCNVDQERNGAEDQHQENPHRRSVNTPAATIPNQPNEHGQARDQAGDV